MNNISNIEPAERQTSEIAVHHESAPERQPDAGSLLSFVAMAVRDPNIDVAKLDALLRMQREIVADDAKAQFNRALHAAQSEMPRVAKNGTILLGEKKGSIPFATWEDVDTVVRPVATKHGFSSTFTSLERAGGGAIMSGTFRHVAGHSETLTMSLPLDTGPGRNNIQAAGSTNSYGKRYLTENFYNIVRKGQDDDGHAAGTVYIDEETVGKIIAELKKRKIPEADFVVAMGVRSVEEIETKNLAAARNAIAAYKPRPPVETGP